MEHNFSGKWITMPAFRNIKPVEVWQRQEGAIIFDNVTPGDSHMLFRTRFQVKGSGRVTLFITADDYYKLYIGGKYVTEGPCPAFPFHYYYNEIDITDYVNEGENTIALHCYYQGLNNRHWVSNDDRSGLLFDIVQDGKVLAKSDETVKCALHTGFTPLKVAGYRLQYLERYDSRSLEVGFEKPDFDDTKWENAAGRTYLDYTLSPQPTRQLSISYIKPQKVEKVDGGYRVDYGACYVGNLMTRAKGPEGEVITYRCGHELNEDGSVRYKMRASTTYEEEWVLSGGEDTLLEYDYKTFRHVDYLCSKDVEILDFTAQVRHYPYEEKAVCQYEEENLQKIWKLATNTLHYGVQDIIQDCFEREKGQYLCDGLMDSMALSVVTKDTAIFEKLIREALRSAKFHPGLVMISPCSLIQETTDYVLMIPEYLLMHMYITKRTDFAEECYDKFAAVLDYFEASFAKEDGLLYDVDQWCVIDWPKESRDGYDFVSNSIGLTPGTHNVLNAYYLGALKAMNSIAKKIGIKPYKDITPIYNSYMEKFYDKAQGFFTDTAESPHVSAPGNAIALRYDLCPDKETEERIVKMLMEKDPELTNFYTAMSSLIGFLRLGKEEELKSYIGHEGRWLRMLREGATTTFEAWGKELKWNTSLFHMTHSFVAMFLTDWGQKEFFEKEWLK
ncbi:MAG: family 78 glycoside hydrolase catalytic domain [Clostridia bacterium]|nr:family 78 glycoside hydrolase catalytic domain [Clostridia bacterium]